MTQPCQRHIILSRSRAIGLSLLAACASGCPAPNPPPVPERSRIALVRERAGAVRVDGINPIHGFAVGRDCTFVHCLELVLSGLGRDIGYDELMGASGMAFRLQFRVDRWDVGSPDPLVGRSCAEELFIAAGWNYSLRVIRREQAADADDLRNAIISSIDAGVPVLAANIIPPEDWGIITGYERAGRNWICRAYHGDALGADRPATGWPTAVVILTDRLPRPAAGPLHVDSIRRAVELFEQRSHQSWALGRSAFEHWSQMLRTAYSPRCVHPNIWTYIGLIDARGAAVRYLRAIAGEFGGRARHLLDAAALYEQEVGILIAGLDHVPSQRQYPDSVPPAEMRMRQVATLSTARALEERAIAALKRAL
jgi:hypothetical protein